MTWSHDIGVLYRDRDRYRQDLDTLAAQGHIAGHPSVDRLIRRIGIVNRLIADAAAAAPEPKLCTCGHPPAWHAEKGCAGDILSCTCAGYQEVGNDPADPA